MPPPPPPLPLLRLAALAAALLAAPSRAAVQPCAAPSDGKLLDASLLALNWAGPINSTLSGVRIVGAQVVWIDSGRL